VSKYWMRLLAGQLRSKLTIRPEESALRQVRSSPSWFPAHPCILCRRLPPCRVSAYSQERRARLISHRFRQRYTDSLRSTPYLVRVILGVKSIRHQ